ncbi:metal ABC transporter substrate-binding protein [Hyalangium minutum]|uniref:Zinc ABC transporter, periplasmic-binding protein ZnuA n=1 Tax=Hyalangium minutum TaxID=394096 RepID=A0A085W3B3_9BACT|nr:metal ABC transporter substrate-binding protein [Hyalangium minutum]KFE62176.1 Zinc ABC transporter, periplasmic-binding protein ZnuA [Hyalangium minutum]
MNSIRRLAVLCTALCSLFALPARADLNVVTTVSDLAAISKAIAGDKGTVTALSLPSQDPHFVDAKPNLALALNKADLLIAIGLDLEIGWLPTLQLGARNSKIQTGNPGYLDASQFVKVLEAPAVKVDRSQGDVHPGGNPHYLHDPRMAVAVARGIQERMAQLDPKNAATYKANTDKFVADVEAARAGWEKRLAAAKGVPVISYHKTTAYLADWLGFQTIEYLEPKPGIPPTPSHVAKVLGLGRQQKVKLVVQEEYYPDSTSKLVASKIPAGIVIFPSGAKFNEGETYLQRMERLTERLEKGLGAK